MDEAEKQRGSGEDAAQQGKGFFTLNLSQVDRMVQQGAGAEEVMAYLVLVRGTSVRSKGVSTHGANSIAIRAGMTHHRSELAMGELAADGYIKKLDGIEDMVKKRRPRWQITEAPDGPEVALANTLVDGIGRGREHPPLARIYNDVGLGKHCVMADARLDTIMVLLHLYRHQSLADYGGINPRDGVFRQWVEAENSYGEKVLDMGGNAALYEIQGGGNTVFNKFAAEALFYVGDQDERHIRFWDAFNNLHRLGLLYEVIQVWTADPERDKKAEPLYTLYVFDRHAREKEPYLSRAIHAAALRCGTLDAYEEFPPGVGWEGSGNIIGTGRFRFVANKKTGGFPIGIYRLKFRPHTRDTGKGMEAEKRRVEKWANALEAFR